MQIIVIHIVSCLIFSVLTAMDKPISRMIIPCPAIQEAAWIDDNTLILNTMEMCYTLNLLTEEKKIVKKYKHYHELIKHPTQPLVTLADHQGITLYNYETKQFQYFKTANNINVVNGTINQCIFNPHDTTIFFYNSWTMFSINYGDQPYQIIDVTTQLKHKFLHNFSQCCDKEKDLWKSFNIAITFHPLKQNICLAEGDRTASIYNLKNSSIVLEIDEERFTSTPFFCEYALNGSLLLLATQNNYPFPQRNPWCNTINIFHISHNGKIILNSIKGNNFVGMTTYKNGSILATISSPKVVLQYWNLITKKTIGKSIALYPEEKCNFKHANFHFIHFSPHGKKIIICKKEYDELIILDVPFDIIGTDGYPKGTEEECVIKSIILQKRLCHDIIGWIILKYLDLSRL